MISTLWDVTQTGVTSAVRCDDANASRIESCRCPGPTIDCLLCRTQHRHERVDFATCRLTHWSACSGTPGGSYSADTTQLSPPSASVPATSSGWENTCIAHATFPSGASPSHALTACVARSAHWMSAPEYCQRKSNINALV